MNKEIKEKITEFRKEEIVIKIVPTISIEAVRCIIKATKMNIKIVIVQGIYTSVNDGNLDLTVVVVEITEMIATIRIGEREGFCISRGEDQTQHLGIIQMIVMTGDVAINTAMKEDIEITEIETGDILTKEEVRK